MTIYGVTRAYQVRLLEQDSAVREEIVSAYALARSNIILELESLIRLIEAARARHQKITLSWLRRTERLQTLLEQVERELAGFAFISEQKTLAAQQAAIALTREYSTSIGDAVAAVGVEWDRLPVEAFAQAVAQVSSASPVHGLFAKLAPKGVAEAKVSIVSSIAKGLNPRQTARELAAILDVAPIRAETIARTEQLRAANIAAQSVYRANSDVVTGWISTAALSSRTCPVCLALHGKVFPLDFEALPWHPNCRCAARPQVRGVPDRAVTGENWFAQQDAAFQRNLLGPGKYNEYAAGRMRLGDLVQMTRHPVWGPGAKEKTLGELRKSA